MSSRKYERIASDLYSSNNIASIRWTSLNKNACCSTNIGTNINTFVTNIRVKKIRPKIECLSPFIMNRQNAPLHLNCSKNVVYFSVVKQGILSLTISVNAPRWNRYYGSCAYTFTRAPFRMEREDGWLAMNKTRERESSGNRSGERIHLHINLYN